MYSNHKNSHDMTIIEFVQKYLFSKYIYTALINCKNSNRMGIHKKKRLCKKLNIDIKALNNAIDNETFDNNKGDFYHDK